MSVKWAVLGVVLATISAPAYAVDWPSFQSKLKPQQSSSPVKASLPSSVSITRPARNVGKILGSYSGVWAGGMCRGVPVDIKIAIEKVSKAGATLVYAVASQRIKPQHWRRKANWQRGMLTFKLPRGTSAFFLRKRADGHMDIKWDNWPRWCTGVLRKIR